MYPRLIPVSTVRYKGMMFVGPCYVVYSFENRLAESVRNVQYDRTVSRYQYELTWYKWDSGVSRYAQQLPRMSLWQMVKYCLIMPEGNSALKDVEPNGEELLHCDVARGSFPLSEWGRSKNDGEWEKPVRDFRARKGFKSILRYGSKV